MMADNRHTAGFSSAYRQVNKEGYPGSPARAWRGPSQTVPLHQLNGDAADDDTHFCEDRDARLVMAEPAGKSSGQAVDPFELRIPFELDNIHRIVNCIDFDTRPLFEKVDDGIHVLFFHDTRDIHLFPGKELIARERKRATGHPGARR